MDRENPTSADEREGRDLEAIAISRAAFDSANRALAESAAQVSRELGALLEETREQLTRSMVETFSRVAAQLRETTEALEPDAFRMGELGWTVPTWEALPLVRTLVRTVPPDELDAFFASLYSRRRREQERELLRELPAQPLLKKWSPLLLEVVHSYRKGHYLVAIPALLAVFEGAVAEAADKAQRLERLSATINARVSGFDAGIERLGWVSLGGFSSTVFRRHEFAAPAPDRLNRHWVQHGRSEPTWTRIDCLRLFQALDTLASLTRDTRTQEG